MSRTLRMGMQGQDVVALQRLLNYHLGLPRTPIPPTGFFGSITLSRVLEFQRLNKLLPTKLPYPADYPAEFKTPLAIDGAVGQHTLHVLLDFRSVQTADPSAFSPDGAPTVGPNVSSSRRFGAGVRQSVGDPPDPQPSPQPTPTPTPTPTQRNFGLVQLQTGTAASVAPWSFSPFSMTIQGVLLAKNAGLPDVLVSGGLQVALNDDRDPRLIRWSGQGFLQLGLGLNVAPSVLGHDLDLLNPFIQAMISTNLSANLGNNLNTQVGAAAGNQISYKLIQKKLPGSNIDQDTLSIFFNGQAVMNMDLNKGHVASPQFSGSAMVGATLTFF